MAIHRGSMIIMKIAHVDSLPIANKESNGAQRLPRSHWKCPAILRESTVRDNPCGGRPFSGYWWHESLADDPFARSRNRLARDIRSVCGEIFQHRRAGSSQLGD